MSTTQTDGSGDSAVARLKTLPHIPLEVLQQIATHLDRKSAFALALTCKGLRDAGETKLYETVHLDAEAEVLNDPDTSTVSEAEAMRCMGVVRQRCEALHFALRTYPYRKECLHNIYVQPYDGELDEHLGVGVLAKRLVDILVLISPYLRLLSVQSLMAYSENGDSVSEVPEELQCAQFFDEIAALPAPEPAKIGPTFPKLSILHLHVPPSHHAYKLPALLHRLTNTNALQELRLVPANGVWSSSLSHRKPDWESHGVALPNLLRLYFHYPDSGSHSDTHLDAILARAPALVQLELSAEILSLRGLPALPRFAQLKNMNRLILMIRNCDTSSSIIQTMTEHAEELVAWTDDVDEIDEADPYSHNYKRLAATKRLTLVTTDAPPLAEYAAAGVSHDRDSERSTRHPDIRWTVGTSFLEGARIRTPNLDTIMFYNHELIDRYSEAPFAYDHEYVVSPVRWQSEGHRGLILREYINPHNFTRSFYHVRCLSRCYLGPGGNHYLGFKRHWEDTARYRSNYVPDDIIRRVYDAVNMDRAWLEPGRDCRMEDAGWKVLEDWFETLPAGQQDAPSIPDRESDGGGNWEDEDDDDGSDGEPFDDQYHDWYTDDEDGMDDSDNEYGIDEDTWL